MDLHEALVLKDALPHSTSPLSEVCTLDMCLTHTQACFTAAAAASTAAVDPALTCAIIAGFCIMLVACCIIAGLLASPAMPGGMPAMPAPAAAAVCCGPEMSTSSTVSTSPSLSS